LFTQLFVTRIMYGYLLFRCLINSIIMSPKKKRYNKNKYTQKSPAKGSSLSSALGNTPNASSNASTAGKVVAPTGSAAPNQSVANQGSATWSAGKSSASQASATKKSYTKPDTKLNSSVSTSKTVQPSRKAGVPDDVYKRRWRFRRILFFLILAALIFLAYLLFGRGLFGNRLNIDRTIDRGTTNLQNEIDNLRNEGGELLNGNLPGNGGGLNTNVDNNNGGAMIEKKMIEVPAAIENVRVNISESFPVQASVVVSGSVADACTELSRTPVQYNALLKRFVIDIVGQKEDNPEVGCTAALKPFNETIPLNIVGLDSGNYSVSVNGETTSFSLDMPNSVDFQGDKG